MLYCNNERGGWDNVFVERVYIQVSEKPRRKYNIVLRFHCLNMFDIAAIAIFHQ